MTARASSEQSTQVRRPGRIIERPRLIKLLDEADAPVILIVAPAGYGKTTLARQWARKLTGVIWVSCTPSHRDVVRFAEDVASGIDELGGAATSFVSEYLSARNNPQRAAREIALVLATELREASVQWLVIDDYHELAQSQEAVELVATLREKTNIRIIVTSRIRPDWAGAREVVYDEVYELDGSQLALTPAEVSVVLGQRPELDPLVREAKGWPAVVALAAGLSSVPSKSTLPSTLHRYVAEELFNAASPRLQQQLVDLTLLPDLSQASLRDWFGVESEGVLDAATQLGFVTPGVSPELHPMLREFLLAKLTDTRDTERVRKAVERASAARQWDLALDLVLRFELTELVDPVLQRAFKPLLRGGRLETLSRFARSVKATEGFPPAALEAVEAEMAMRNGDFALAASIAERAHAKLPDGHDLKCRTSLLAGRAHVLSAAFPESIRCFRAAATEALDNDDKVESAFGLVSAQTFGELGDSTGALAELSRLRSLDPTNLIRHATAASTLRRIVGFQVDVMLDEAVDTLARAGNPQVRTAFTYTYSYCLCLQGEYRRAEAMVDLFERDVDAFDLDFARPFLDWTRAFVALGLRRFGHADRLLQRVEDAAAQPQQRSHAFNARVLRARLMLQTGEAASALEALNAPAEAPVYKSWKGELMATKALAYASLGMHDEASLAASEALRLTRFVEVVLLAHSALAVSAAGSNTGRPAAVRLLFEQARRFDTWDGVVCGLRVSRALAQEVASDPELRPQFKRLLERTGDTALGRQVGLYARSSAPPDSLLSPRELEVLGLMARGMRNKEIAAALFVAESTIKVHVRHILEKLGVGSRSAAVARYERTAKHHAD